MSAATALDGYARIAPAWRAAGWPMLPVHRGAKALDVTGFTGAGGADPTTNQYDEWDRDRAGDNAAIRMLPDVVGIDVDAYKPEGAQSWAELLEECGGPPPDTYIITSRTDEVSGIRLYRTPPATRLKGAPRKGIEAIQRWHRYAMAPGSLHPEGRRYRLIDPTGEIANIVPTPDSLPMLPDAWVAALAEPVRDASAPPVRRYAGDWSPSVTKAFADAVASLVEGSRHDTAKEAAAALARYEQLGHPGATDALDALGSTFVSSIKATPGSARHRGHNHQKEWDDLLSSARNLVAGTPATAPTWQDHLEPLGVKVTSERRNGQQPPPPPGVDPETGEILRLHLPDEFYDSRPVLTHISRAARARQRSRDAVLHVVLARVAAAVPHFIKLPPIVGSPSPLCYFAITLAPPGYGKGDAGAIGTELLPVDDYVADQLPIGSGEGLAEVLFDLVTEEDNGKPVKVKRLVRHNAFVIIDEGDVLSQLGTRSGSTLLSTTRSIWSGKVIGNTNAARENRRIVPAGAYTFGIVVGLQDTKAGPLLDEVGAGTPQRFGWSYAIDPQLPDRPPSWPGPLTWYPPDEKMLDTIYTRRPPDDGPTHPLHVHPDIAAEIVALDLARAKGEGPQDPWQAHSTLLRLRIAALLAILDQQLHISVDDWQLAGTVKAVSDNVRAHAQNTVIAEATQKERQTSTRLANRAAEADVAVRQRRVIHCAEKISDKVHAQPEGWTVSTLRRDLRSWREVFDEALAHAKIEGWVIERTEPGQGTDKRTLVPGVQRSRRAA
jgi:Bifunctional DNA primase/polymerase, N-terminal